MSTSSSHSRHPSGSSSVSSAGSYSRPLSSRSTGHPQHQQPNQSSAPTASSSQEDYPPRSYSRPRAGGVDFGQPLAEETAGTRASELTNHQRSSQPPSSSSSSRSQRESRYSSAGHSTASSTSSSGSSRRPVQRERQTSSASAPLPQSSSSTSSAQTNRLSQPVPLSPPTPTSSSSRSNRSPISPTHPNYSPTLPGLRRQASVPPRTSSLQRPSAGRPTPSSPSTIASRRISKAPSIGSLSTASGLAQQAGSYVSPYRAQPAAGPVRSSSARGEDNDATVRQRTETRPIVGRASFESAPSSWKAPGRAEADEPVRVQGRRRSSLVQSEAARGREMLDSSTDDDADDLLGYQELNARRPSWVSIKMPALSMPSGRSDSTSTITQASTRRDAQDQQDALMDEPPLLFSHSQDSLTKVDPIPQAQTSKDSASSTGSASSPFPSTSTVSHSSPRSGVRPPPIVLPSSSTNFSDPAASATKPSTAPAAPLNNSHGRAPAPMSIAIPSPVLSPPALPTRSPLRPRLSSPTPSQSSSSSSTGGTRHHRESADHRVSAAFSDASVEMGHPQTNEADSSRLGVGAPPSRTDRIRSVSSPGVASWSSANGKERESAFEPTLSGAPEVWLDDDLGHPNDRQRNGSLASTATSSLNGSAGDGEARPRSRPQSVTSRPGSERMKQKRREARVTTMYVDSASGSDGSDHEHVRSSMFSSTSLLPTLNGSVAAGLPFANRANSQAAFASAPSLGARSPSCPAFSSLEEIPDEVPTLPSELTIKQSLNLAASPTITLPPPTLFSEPRPSSPAHTRSSSHPLPSSSVDKPLPTPTSKRAHLLHEIHSTERSYAQDLALVRDAYINRLRPPSTPMSSSRNSAYFADSGATFLTEDSARTQTGDRTSKSSAPGNLGGLGIASNGSHATLLPAFSPDGARSPLAGSDAGSVKSNPYFASSGTVSSPRSVLSPGSTFGGSSLGLAVGPLSAGDARAVFLNVEAIATLAEEFASVLERMAAQPEGEDMMGEAFLTMMPRIKQAYSTYCPRQSAANVRLVELLADPRYATYFAESWSIAQPHTKSWDLPSLLIKPVQRVLKYPLLLDDLLKCTPSTHPDHANLSQAVTLVRTLADEINEAKRRKDTVDRIIQGKHADVSSTSSIMSKESKSKRGASIKIGFRKDKDRVTSVATSVRSSASTASTQFGSKAHNELRSTEERYAKLVTQLMAAETTAKKMGKIVAGCGTKAKEAWEAQMQTVEGWRRLINLGGLEPVEDIRIEAYRVVVHQILEGPCKEMDEEVRVSIVPNVLALLAVCKGPRTVILKRNSKHGDYNKVVNATNSGQWDKLAPDLIEGAQIFAALHHQLLVELPDLLLGFAKILDLITCAIAQCQTKFHKSVYRKLDRFWTEFPPVVVDPGTQAVDAPCSDGPAIMQVWQEAARTPMEMMEALAITQKITVRVMEPTVLIASGSSTPNAHGILSRTPSTLSIRRTETNSSADRRVRRSTASSSSTSSLPFETRSRSSSNAKAPPPAMPTPPSPMPTADAKTGGLFHFRTKSKSKTSSTKLERNPSQSSVTNSPAAPALSSRSQTLPPLPIPGGRPAKQRNSAHSTTSSTGPALSAMSFEGSDQNHEAFSEAFTESVARRLSEPDEDDPDRTIGYSSSNGPVHPYAAMTPSKTANGRRNAPGVTHVEAPAGTAGFMPPTFPDEGLDSPSPAMYRCECVADFDLRGLSISYMGHDFLSIQRGDVIDVVFEIGRVDELEAFPLDVGLEDDGLLIGRDQTGTTGFVLCSFLHPLDAE